MATARKTTARKPTAARKPAVRAKPRPRAVVPIEVPELNGNHVPEVNGHVPPPERFEPKPQPHTPAPAAPELVHPYGDRAVYVFHPKQVRDGDSMDPIVFPAIHTLDADVEFFWELDEMDPMHQAFRYMKRAGVPRDIQRRVVRLPEDEAARFLKGWFEGILSPQGVAPPGES